MNYTAEELIALGYLQTSARHCTLGRIPPGWRVFDLLCETDPDFALELRRQLEARARACLLRVHRVGEITVSKELLREFRALGGEVA
jgi:hypothetical protein